MAIHCFVNSRHLDSLVVVVIGFLLEVLLQERVSFGLLCPHTAKKHRWYEETINSIATNPMSPAGLEGGVIACGVGLVDAGTILNIIGDQDHRAAEGAHLGVLCVHLEGTRSRSYLLSKSRL